ncbi:unnamed protein product [Rhizophagus irregularis]|uniref:Uncharacterized protein n=1 Tax=Rhizophagus irregularis TaxID=588596 RepID=A0A915ZZ37_9GLOM|nr:unnamed protein product [Rhizophagus irregularis]CAB5395768.1 unnamed protein product [Rhizophagus irregularis]
MSGIHEYFKRTFLEWDIEDFLNKFDIEQFDIKIDSYLKSLEIIADYETGKRKERATLLLNKYRKTSQYLLTITKNQTGEKWMRRVFLDDSVAFDENGEENSHGKWRENRVLSIETDYREILSLSHILLLQADYFSDLQIEQFSKGVKTILQECIETALDEDLRPKEAERIVEQSFTKTFNDPVDQKKLERMRFIFLQLTKNIPVTSVTINIYPRW